MSSDETLIAKSQSLHKLSHGIRLPADPDDIYLEVHRVDTSSSHQRPGSTRNPFESTHLTIYRTEDADIIYERSLEDLSMDISHEKDKEVVEEVLQVNEEGIEMINPSDSRPMKLTKSYLLLQACQKRIKSRLLYHDRHRPQVIHKSSSTLEKR